MTERQRFRLVAWLLFLWDFCDQLSIDALLHGFGDRECIAALDDVEHELAMLGIDNPSAALASLRQAF